MVLIETTDFGAFEEKVKSPNVRGCVDTWGKGKEECMTIKVAKA